MSENRLGRETSPYLLQHQDNPVHWWAWRPEALAEAKRTGKPILLSVGYAACHWCHVMAHESFEDDATADVMNELFVNIKVDREERPDIDAIYMSALHHLGEQGGWPLTMFLDSDAKPFWGGTYFPKEQRFGKPAFTDRAARGGPHPSRRAGQGPQQHRAAGRCPGLGSRRPARPPHPQRCRAEGPHHAHGRRRRYEQGRPARRAQVSAMEFLLAALARRHPLRSRHVPPGRRGHAHQHLPGRHLRSSRRRLRPLLGGRALARAALREDALRQRPARGPADGGLARDTQPALQGARGGNGRLAHARDDRRGRRLRRLARCRLGRRGRQVLRLDRARDRRRARRRGCAPVRARLRRHAGRQLGRPHDPQPPLQSGARLRGGGSQARRAARQAAGASRVAHPSRLGRQGAGRLERPDDRRARARRARLRSSPTGSPPPSAPSPSSNSG